MDPCGAAFFARHVTREGFRRAAFFGGIAASSATLFAISRGKWSDAIVDSGREWIVPDALARGEVLYRDVVYWFGPFTPYFQAAFLALFGSTFRTLVLAGIVASVGILICLYLALRVVLDRWPAAAWTVLAIPMLVFMPSAGGSILGMGFRMWHAAGFGLLALTAAASRPYSPGRDFLAGGAAALAGLCRTEWGIAALAAVGVALFLRGSGLHVGVFLRVFTAWFAVFAAGLLPFFLLAGPAALLHDAPVLLIHLPPDTRAAVAAAHPGTWLRGALQMLYGALVWTAAFVALDVFSPSSDERSLAKRRFLFPGALLSLAALCAAAAGFPSNVLLCAAPLACAASLVIAFRSPRGPLAACLGGFGALGVLSSYRRPFFLADGPYVAPPVLFAIVCAAACAARFAAARPPAAARRLSARTALAVGALAGILFLVRAVEYAADDRVVLRATGGMLSAPAPTARKIEIVADVLRARAPAGDLVVFPEGEVLNYLSGRRNPIRHKLYLPGYLDDENEKEVLTELVRARPAALVIWPRPLGEYGRGEFGVDYGIQIREWIRREYDERAVPGGSGRRAVVAFRRPA